MGGGEPEVYTAGKRTRLGMGSYRFGKCVWRNEKTTTCYVLQGLETVDEF